MEIRPMLSALVRRKAGPLLVALQIAVALAICVNAAYVMALQIESAREPSGLDVDNIFWISSEGYAGDFNFRASVRADLQLLRSMPGVVAATTISAIPLSGDGFDMTYYTKVGQKGIGQFAGYFYVDEGGLDALGVKLVAGRSFDPAIVLQPPDGTSFGDLLTLARLPPEVIVTSAVAKKLFPGENALGKTIYGADDRSFKIVGIIDHMQRLGFGEEVDPADQDVVLHPAVYPGPNAAYLVRTKPGRRDELMTKAEAALTSSQSGRVIDTVEALADTASRTAFGARNTAELLALMVTSVLTVTMMGIFGLAMFNVTSRNKQIGIRRAVGARKRDIIAYFLVENWIITTGGIIVGCILALSINIALSPLLQAPRLPLYYLLGGVLGLWTLGLAAAFVPARRAAAVAPAVATRTV
jgi:putative ABC transport system permease protein